MMGYDQNAFIFGKGPDKRIRQDPTPASPITGRGFGNRSFPESLVRKLDALRKVNELEREPCPTCGNRVRPELQAQHDRVYHATPTTNGRDVIPLEKSFIPDGIRSTITPSTKVTKSTELRLLKERASTLYEALAHGDDIHKDWLKEAIANHFAGLPVPTLR